MTRMPVAPWLHSCLQGSSFCSRCCQPNDGIAAPVQRLHLQGNCRWCMSVQHACARTAAAQSTKLKLSGHLAANLSNACIPCPAPGPQPALRLPLHQSADWQAAEQLREESVLFDCETYMPVRHSSMQPQAPNPVIHCSVCVLQPQEPDQLGCADSCSGIGRAEQHA